MISLLLYIDRIFEGKFDKNVRKESFDAMLVFSRVKDFPAKIYQLIISKHGPIKLNLHPSVFFSSLKMKICN